MEWDEKHKPKRASLLALFKYASWEEKLMLAIGFLFRIVASCMYPSIFVFLGWFVNSMENSYDRKRHKLDKDKFWDQTYDLEIAMMSLALGSIFAGYASAFLISKFGFQQGNKYRAAYIHSLMSKKKQWFDARNSYEIPSQLMMDTMQIEEATGNKMMLTQVIVGTFLFSLSMGMKANLQLTLVDLSSMPIGFIGFGFIGYSISKMVTKLSEANKQARGISNESIENIKTVAANNMQEYVVARYDESLRDTEAVQRKTGSIFGFGWGLTYFHVISNQGFVYFIGSLFVAKDMDNWIDGNHLDIGDIFQVIFLIQIWGMVLGYAAPGIQGMVEGLYAAQRIADIIDALDENESSTGQLKPEIEGSIEFKDVNFSYPSQPYHTVLNKVNFKIDKGQRVAFVGETGCGKSTIISLLQGLYDDYSGQIQIDGIEIKQMDKKSLRDSIGLVSQDPILFNTTAYDNIMCGKLSANESEIHEAARKANIHDFIIQLPNGYNTICGSKGCQISGGQKQRISIARAILRNPKILLLDEATSSLDRINEIQIMENLWELSQDRTAILVAQRLSTIQEADCICVINKGEIAESGSHTELLQEHGVYYDLVNRQIGLENRETKAQNESSVSNTTQKKFTQKSQLSDVKNKEENTQKTQNLWLRVLTFSKSQAHWLVLLFISAIVAGATQPIAGIFTAKSLWSFFIDNNDTRQEKIGEYAIAFAMIAFVMLLGVFSMGVFQSTAGSYFTSKMRIFSLKSILTFDAEYFDKNDKANIANSLAHDTDQTYKLGGPLISFILMISAAMTCGVGIAWYHNWQIGITALVVTPLFTMGMNRRNKINMQGATKPNYQNNIANDALVNFSMVRAYNLQNHIQDVYMRQNAEIQKDNIPALHKTSLEFGFANFCIMISISILWWVTAYVVWFSDEDPQNALKAFATSIMLASALTTGSAFAPDLSLAYQSTKRLFDIIDTVPSIYNPKNPDQSTVNGQIEFSNVSFSYPIRDTLVLNCLSFTVTPGMFFSITGSSGSGKSTIMQLLIRLYDCSDGCIYIDRRPIQDFNVRSLRDSINYVSQDPILFSGSISDNLNIGKFSGAEEVLNAVEYSQCQDFVMQYGLERDVGTGGSLLSGGQKQRLSIARALLRNPKILLLDEATSALDSKHEADVLSSLQKLTPKITIVTIAHRPSSIQNSDVVAVMELGSIVEIGPPTELLEKKGLYYGIMNSGTPSFEDQVHVKSFT